MSRGAAAALLLAVSLALTAGAAHAQDWTVRTEVLDGTVVQGEPFRVCVTVVAHLRGIPAINVSEPIWGDSLLPTEASYESQQWNHGDYEYSECWNVVAQRSGPVSVPPVRVTLTRPDSRAPETETTAELIVTVRPPPEPQSDRGTPPSSRISGEAPHSGPTPFQWWVIGGLAGTIVVSATAAMAWLRHGERSSAPEALDPASAEARVLRDLAALRRSLELADLVPFYSGLAMTVAGYVARRGGLGDTVLTSTEARAELERQGAPPELRQAVIETLHTADEVRFARGTPQRAQAEELLGRLQQLLADAGRRTSR